MREKAWAAISQFNWDRGGANARPGGEIQGSSIVSIHYLGFVGLKFNPLPSRAESIAVAVPIGRIRVFNNEIRAMGRRKECKWS